MKYPTFFFMLPAIANALQVRKPKNIASRRSLLQGAGLAGLVSLVVTPSAPSAAFENKISTQYDDRPKRRGATPPDLGVMTRKNILGEEYLGLKHCGAALNCFCSTDSLDDDAHHSIPAWVWPKELGGKEEAFAQLLDIVAAYEPGQSGIDGGGFKIVKSDPKGGYIYAQFESLKNGYIDDLELAYIDGSGERVVQVRSSSRLGYLDFGVNSKRLNFIASKLRENGWDAEGVKMASHQNYAILNELV